ncbi:YjdJ family protein [Schinkia azotoformans]|uniref:DUF4306 domain-containing protein n=1 Tax=Schinkia azotoformans LMG 9581 TaxID=1131731 RepID=K6D755_SCHAZ|nr:YjdJ family protein [Schinkia azotoformans]EKN64119.1 hypothetical protein BAZO_14754 [Schinkia azotoformans LMG 9581]MEC1945435.1 YjdJ family protein [Schinkia azotoformans]
MVYILQYCIFITLFLFFTLLAWYEGSALLDVQWEWKYTAFFSNVINGAIKKESDISQLDFFLYAAKFRPVFPIFMVLTLSYIVTISAKLVLKNSYKKLILFYSLFGLLFFFLTVFVSDSPTIGGKYFTILFIILSIINFTISLYHYIFRVRGMDNTKM